MSLCPVSKDCGKDDLRVERKRPGTFESFTCVAGGQQDTQPLPFSFFVAITRNRIVNCDFHVNVLYGVRLSLKFVHQKPYYSS